MLCFGICALSVLNMRAVPSDKGELVNQVLFGELYTVLEKSPDEKWLHIETEWDEYKGWISALSHQEISEAYYVRYRLGQHAMMTEPIGKAILHGQKHPTLVPFASGLPFWDKKNVDLDTVRAQCAGKGQVGKPDNLKPMMLLGVATFLHAPYLWGGRTALGIDCSGFTQNVFKANWIRLDRDAYQQAQQCTPITLAEAKTGDLAFFERGGRVVHVGIVLSPQDAPMFEVNLPAGKPLAIAHALEKVRVDALDAKGIFHLQHQEYTHQLISVGRVC